MKKKLGIALMAVGVICIAAAVALLLYNYTENKNAGKSSAIIMDSLRMEISKNEVENTASDPFDTEMEIAEIDGNGYIGYISIPILDLDLPVMAEWSYDKLKAAPCRYYGSAKTDNLVIAAHDYSNHFGYIGNLKPDDTLMFTDINGKVYSYKVTSVDLVMPSDTDKVKDTGDDLILYTCNYGGTKRICVRCSYLK
ncbi:MAG: sortase [Clostridia bacterium]|nr:sortase [Clostridia bacterium]